MCSRSASRSVRPSVNGKPPIDVFREHGVPLVVATDANPWLFTNSAATDSYKSGLRALWSHAGGSDGRNDEIVRGCAWFRRQSHEVGRQADLACWSISEPAELAYWVGGVQAQAVVSGGRRIR